MLIAAPLAWTTRAKPVTFKGKPFVRDMDGCTDFRVAVNRENRALLWKTGGQLPDGWTWLDTNVARQSSR